MASESMGRWTSVFVYGFGFILSVAGLGGIVTGTIGGFVGGVILGASGLILIPQTRPIVTEPISYAGGPDLSGMGTAAVILIVIVGTVAGTAIVPTADTEQTTTVPEGTETPTVQPTATPTSTPEPTAPPTPEATTTPPSTPASTATPTPTEEPTGSLENGLTVTIVDVIDGDTMDVQKPDGSIETIRLLGVDTPETSVTETSPDEWEGIPDTTDGRDWLVNWGDDATSYAEDRLAGEEVVIQTDPESDQRGYYGRLLVYVYQGQSTDTSFNMRLIENGYARYYSSSFSMSNEYQTAESDAQLSNTGVWDYTTPDTPTPTERSTSGSPDDIEVAGVHADADGNDHDNLNDEYITLQNSGDSTINMGGWTLSDSADHTYHFPSGFSLGPGESGTIYTGSGSNSGSELYWGSSSAVWNNGGDTIIVVTDDGEQVINYEY